MLKVTLYTINDCHHCDMLRDILFKHRVKFEEVKWNRKDEDTEDKFKKLTGESGARFPVTKIGKELVISFDMIKIDKLLKLTQDEEPEDEEIALEELTK